MIILEEVIIGKPGLRHGDTIPPLSEIKISINVKVDRIRLCKMKLGASSF